MANIIWLNWSGGGNLPPSLGIARVLTERGHTVTFAGRPEMMPRVEQAGFPALELTRSYEQLACFPADKWIPRVACCLASPAVGEEIRALLSSERPDLVIVDAMFLVALAEAGRFDGPTVVMCHTSVNRMCDAWRKTLAMMAALRVEAGFDPLPAEPDDLWMSKERLIVTTLESLDQPGGRYAHPERMRHVGPVLERERHAESGPSQWPDDDPTPLVLVSFSTAPEQTSRAKVQAAIDALSTLPVRGVVTLGDGLDPGTLAAAANVSVVGAADHDALMRRAAVVLTHGGHGTMMRALSHGLPMVLIPGMAADQPINAMAVEGWGAGRALAGDADVVAIRSAVREVLASPSFAAAARELARRFIGVDGAVSAADEIEEMLGNRLSADRQPARVPIAAWPHEAGEYRPIPWD